MNVTSAVSPEQAAPPQLIRPDAANARTDDLAQHHAADVSGECALPFLQGHVIADEGERQRHDCRATGAGEKAPEQKPIERPRETTQGDEQG